MRWLDAVLAAHPFAHFVTLGCGGRGGRVEARSTLGTSHEVAPPEHAPVVGHVVRRNVVCLVVAIVHALTLALLLAGCAHLPATMRPATPEELSAVDALTEAWAASGREVPTCPVLDRVDVYTGPQADVASWCAREGSCSLSACTFAPNRYVWATPSTALYIREDVSHERHLRLVMHELAHQLRGCWREHIDHGESEACQITQPVDGRHCDAELWGPILRDAADRLEAPR